MRKRYSNLTEKDIFILENPNCLPYVDDFREILAELINVFSPNAVGVEIGVCRAATSRYILDHTTTTHLHLIDPWKFYRQSGYHDILKSQKRADELYSAVLEVMDGYECSIHRKSIEGVDELPDNLGFAFIDGNHTYAGVMNDLNCIVPKLKSNSLICGHDWTKNYPGVIKAVTDYFTEHKDEFQEPFDCYEQLKFGHCPAPSLNPIVNKSWEKGHLWWTIKR
jgi:hypothetical protein